jgi:uncharacterized protein (DUF488 family)
MDDTKILDMPLHVIFALFLIELNEMEDAPGIVISTEKVFKNQTTLERAQHALAILSNERFITENLLRNKHYKVSWRGKEVLALLHEAFTQYSNMCKREQQNKISRDF